MKYKQIYVSKLLNFNTKLIIGLPKYVKYACNFIENSFFFYRNSEMVLIFCQTLYGAQFKSENIPTKLKKKSWDFPIMCQLSRDIFPYVNSYTP